MPDAVELGVTARQRNARKYTDIIRTLVPIAQRLAGIFGEYGITAATVRRVAIRRGLIQAESPTHYLSSVMKQAGLVSNGQTRKSTMPSTKGRRILVYRQPGPYAAS